MEVTYKSDVIVVGFRATPSQRSLKLTSRFMGLFLSMALIERQTSNCIHRMSY